MVGHGTYRYTNKYIEVFSCVFMHDYYEDRVCNEIIIKPAFATGQLLKNLNLIFKRTYGGFALAADAAKDYSNPVFHESFHLDFEFLFTNVNFYAFTALDPNPESKYFIDDLKDTIYLNHEQANPDPSLDRHGITGIIRVKHDHTNPVLPIGGAVEGEFQPRVKLIYLKPRDVKLVYLCYASEEKISRFDGFSLELEGEFKDILAFDVPERIVTIQNLPAYRFSSQNTIPMRDYWNGLIRIEKTDQFGIYKRTLPNPRAGNIKFDLTTNSFISENYVKL